MPRVRESGASDSGHDIPQVSDAADNVVLRHAANGEHAGWGLGETIQRETGVTYKTAWRMMAQVRKLMAEQGIKLAGPVEIDDAVFGGSDSNKHLELRGGAKQAVVGIVARHSGKVVTRVVDAVTKEAAEAVVGEVLPPATTIYSDQHLSYQGLGWMEQAIAI